MKVYVDIDTGTVLNGPIYEVESLPEDNWLELGTDDDARDWARTYGKRIS